MANDDRAAEPHAAAEQAPGSGREILKAGAAAGMIGGILMAAWATLYAAGTGAGFLFPLRLVGTTILGERSLVGGPHGPLAALLIHLGISVVCGVVFTAILGRRARATVAVPAGLLFGVSIFFVMTVGVLPRVNPAVAAEARHVPAPWVVGHLLFGIGVACGPALRRNMARAGPGRPLRLRPPGGARTLAPRAVNVVLGSWLFISAFAWEHSAAELANTALVGAACVFIALVAMAAPAARWANVALAGWLFSSVFLLPKQSSATTWNNTLVAVAIALFAITYAATFRGTGASGVPRKRPA